MSTKFYSQTADASRVFHPSAAAPSGISLGTAVNGNFADILRNGSVFRSDSFSTQKSAVIQAPKIYQQR